MARQFNTSAFPAALGAIVLAACTAGSAEDGMPEAEDASAAQTAEATATQEPSCFLQGATVADAEGRPSPLRQVRFEYGDGGEGLLCHGAPSARGRDIMGGLVPYGELWRAGANESTALHLSAPASIGGVAVEAGSYSIYTIPGESSWQVFVNSNFQRWGIPISDAVRATEIGSFTVTPETTATPVETLTYRFEGGAVVMEWANTRLRIPIG